MRYCHFPFRNIYVDFEGQVRLCAWTNGAPIGYITDGLEKLWHSEAARELRQSILDGSFSRCRKNICPHIMNDTLPDIPDDTAEKLTPAFPDEFMLGYDYQCNLACPSCRKDFIKGSPRAEAFFAKVYEQLAPHLDNLSFLDLCGHGDPFFSKHSMFLLENLRPRNPRGRINFETNGIFFTPSTWKRIEHLASCELNMTVSVESLNSHVYATLRRGGNFDRLHENLRFMSRLRREGVLKTLNAVMVVQDLNFTEIPAFMEYCFGLGFDSVNLENLYSWGTFTDKEYFFKNLLNPLHPQHALYKEILAEALKDKRVFCWAGQTNRIETRCTVLGQSHLAIADIAETDVVDAEADLVSLSDAIYNRGYIFVTSQGRYYGMLMYEDFHSYMGDKNCVPCSAKELCRQQYQTIDQVDIGLIFADKEKLLQSEQCVYPVLDNGILRGKLLVEH